MREHSERYLETDGEEGHEWRGVPTRLLTTLGLRSRQPRRQALIYGQDGGNYVVVASKTALAADQHLAGAPVDV